MVGGESFEFVVRWGRERFRHGEVMVILNEVGVQE